MVNVSDIPTPAASNLRTDSKRARLMTLGPKNLRLYYSYFWQKEASKKEDQISLNLGNGQESHE